MYRCNYCGIKTEDIYNNCPNCGSVEFSSIPRTEIIKREVPPEKGYKISIRGEISKLMAGLVVTIFAIAMIAIAVHIHIKYDISMEGISKIGVRDLTNYIIRYFFYSVTECAIFIVGMYILIAGLMTMSETFPIIFHSKRLSKHGILVKNLPYLETTSQKMNYSPMNNYISVLYQFNEKESIKLKKHILDLHIQKKQLIY